MGHSIANDSNSDSDGNYNNPSDDETTLWEFYALALGCISNVLKDHIIQGERLGLCNFGVMVERVLSALWVQPYMVIYWSLYKKSDQKNRNFIVGLRLNFTKQENIIFSHWRSKLEV